MAMYIEYNLVKKLQDDLGDCRDALQDWEVAAGTRQAEIDALRAEVTRLRNLLTELTYTPDNPRQETA